MPVTTASAAPYAPASAILDIIKRYRAKGLPVPITAEVLGRASVSDSLIPRTLQALQTLDLIDAQGAPTGTLEGLRLAPESEFKQRLAEWLNAAYADVLQFIDPATADEVMVRDAFRSYNPIGQQPRMVTLFIGLYAAAGVGPQKDAQPRTSRPSARVARTQTAAAPTSAVRKTSAGRGAPADAAITGTVPAALAGLLASLPPEGRGWTAERRNKFVTTFSAVLDFCFPIVEREATDAESDES